MPSIQVIGCSSGAPHRKFACSSYLLQQKARRILFDCGEGSSSAMARLRIDPRSIETIFISHMHPDHCMGLPLFIQANYILKRKSRLDIFVPSEAVSGVRNLFKLTYLYPLKLPFELEVHGFTPGTVFEMSDLIVRARQTTHLQRHAQFVKAAGLRNKMQCFSYVIEVRERRIIYSGDLGSDADLAAIASGCDLLILEQSHIDDGNLCNFLNSKTTKRVIITHLDSSRNANQLKEIILRETAVKDVFVAFEGLIVRV